jgi:hypothetical protein
MHRTLLLLISLILIACSAAASVETPTPPPPSATSTVETPRPPAVSVTPGEPACFNTPTSLPPATNPLGVWRVRHDVERKDWNCKARLWVEGWKVIRGLPETVRINGGRGTVELSPAWVKFLDSINTPDAQRFLRKQQNGWLNYGPFPKMEQLTFGGNFVEVTRIKGNKAFIKSYNNADIPPAIDPDTNPIPNTLIQTFSVVYTDGSWEMSTPVGLVYTFIIANPEDGELWIDIDDLIR